MKTYTLQNELKEEKQSFTTWRLIWRSFGRTIKWCPKDFPYAMPCYVDHARQSRLRTSHCDLCTQLRITSWFVCYKEKQ